MSPSPEEAGRSEAEAFDQRLRAVDASEREVRLARAGGNEAVHASAYQPAVDVARLQTRLEELIAFRKAVQASLVWRAAQGVRRLLGRAW